MALWDWIAKAPEGVATTATPATTEGGRGHLSQLSQLSQGVEAEVRSSNGAVPKPREWERSGFPLRDWGDTRPCTLCRNLTKSGRCLAAWRGELRAARDWGPTYPGQPHRCIGYLPKPDDPDQTSGRERWPEFTWQARLPDR